MFKIVRNLAFALLAAFAATPSHAQITPIQKGVTYQGAWNASTNTPAIPTASAFNKGYYYVVSVAGTTSISGHASWSVGDWIVSNGSTWDQLGGVAAGGGAVTSVNTRVGAVTLTSTDVALGNLVNSLQVINAGNSVSMQSGTHAGRPAAGTDGKFYIETDTLAIFRDNGSSWIDLSPALTGDITTSAGSLATTLASVISAGGPTGSASVVPVITYDAKGRLTTVTTANIAITTAAVSSTPSGTGAVSVATSAQWPNNRIVTPKMYGAVGDNSTDDTTAIQNMFTAAAANNYFVVFDQLTYKCTSALTANCEMEGRGAILSFPQDFNSTALTVGAGSGSSTTFKYISTPEIDTTRSVSTGWAAGAANGIGLQLQNLQSCRVIVGRLAGWAEGLRLTNADATGFIYCEIDLPPFQSCKIAGHILCANGGWVNSNKFHNGRVQYSGGITNGQTGSYSFLIEGQVSNHDANNNSFYGFGTEGDVNQYALYFKGCTYNEFYSTRLEQTTPTIRFEGITGNDCTRNHVLLGYATGGITRSNGTLGYDNFIWGPTIFGLECGGDNAGFQLVNRSGDTNYIFTLWGSADKDIINIPGSATTWLTRIGAGRSDYKLAANSQPRIRIDAQAGGKLYFGDGSTALGAYLINYNANVGVKLVSGDMATGTAGFGFRVTEGSNAKMGTAVLVGGTVTVSNTSVTGTSRIFLTSNTDGGTPGWLRVSGRVIGTSFTITSSSGTDTSTVAYIIFEPS
jgi:hypothetical protein